MFKKILIAALILRSVLLLDVVNAQTQDMKFMIKGEPLYLFNNGLCVNFEKRLSNSKKWLMVSPQFYVNYDNSNGDGWDRKNYLKFTGGGLDLTVKNFILKKLYFGYGAVWQYYHITLPKLIWQPYNEADLNVLIPESQNYTEQINKLGMNAIIGFQNRMLKGMYFDIYVGIGFRYSFCHSHNGPEVKFDDNPLDFGYTGINVVGGVRVGVGF